MTPKIKKDLPEGRLFHNIKIHTILVADFDCFFFIRAQRVFLLSATKFNRQAVVKLVLDM